MNREGVYGTSPMIPGTSSRDCIVAVPFRPVQNEPDDITIARTDNIILKDMMYEGG